MSRYATFVWEHMGREEGVILPAAQRYLLTEDWSGDRSRLRREPRPELRRRRRQGLPPAVLAHRQPAAALSGTMRSVGTGWCDECSLDPRMYGPAAQGKADARLGKHCRHRPCNREPLAGEGARVIVNGRTQAPVDDAVAHDQGRRRGEVLGFAGDLSSRDVREALVARSPASRSWSTTSASSSPSPSKTFPMTTGGVSSTSTC